ncbi:MAG: hypothetical protein RQ731_00170 [Anaerosomatales bacterium]|nr:hypothetical protein [Anaerosomatales bacterium]MDT8433168.1 hypothetical protein [Anaerosomatales bacterium]
MIECTEAQQVISAAFDGEFADAPALEVAKEHCRTCSGCAVFVTTLAAMNRLPAPEMPGAALERILATVSDEYATQAEEPLAVMQEVQEVREVARLRVPVWAPWAAAAAVLLVAAGVVTTQGVRYLLKPLAGVDTAAEVSVTDTADDRQAEFGAESDLSAAEPPAQDGLLIAAEGPSYVVFGDAVYRLVGTAAGEPAGTRVGSVTSALDTGGAASDRPVYADPSSDGIVVIGDDDALLRFEPVVRMLRGTAYAQRSGTIGGFGQWPSLPQGIPEPAAPDGSPAFIAAGTDDAGATVYVRPGTDPSDGFAIAPGTSPSDPAAGNSAWTWWEPRR